MAMCSSCPLALAGRGTPAHKLPALQCLGALAGLVGIDWKTLGMFRGAVHPSPPVGSRWQGTQADLAEKKGFARVSL